MSDANKQDLVPGGQSEANEEGGLDPGSFGGAVVPVEWLAAVAGFAALLAFQVVVKAFEEKGHEEEVAWPATMENEDIEPVEKEEAATEEEEEEELRADHQKEVEDDYGEEEEEEGDDDEEDGERGDNSTEEEEEEEEEAVAVTHAYFPEGRVLGAETIYKLGYYFRDLVVPKPLSFLAKEAIAYNYEYSDDESEESGVEEDEEEVDENEELEGPKKNLDSEEGSFS